MFSWTKRLGLFLMLIAGWLFVFSSLEISAQDKAPQGDKQEGQSGDQGEKQNGQAGDQGEKQNGQAGDQGEKQNDDKDKKKM